MQEKLEGRSALNKSTILIVFGIFLGLGIMGYFLFKASATPEMGESFQIQGRQHIKLGEQHPPYNSTPPTSGWHYTEPAPWGISDAEIPNETQIHNLEHGGVMVQYQPNIDAQTPDQLKNLMSNYKAKVILAPYQASPSKIVLTAWGRMLKLDGFQEQKIKDFISAYKDKGPEHVPDETNIQAPSKEEHKD